MSDEIRRICPIKFQGEDEKIMYSIETTEWGSSPTNVVVKGYNVSSGSRVDQSDTILEGVYSVVDDVIFLPRIKSLVPGNLYRIEIKFDSVNGNTYEAYFDIFGEH